MEMITPDDIGGDPDIARRVIVYARSIAPCLDSLEDGQGADDPKPKSDAIAILRGVVAEVPRPGSRRVKSERAGSGSAEYFQMSSAFTDDDRSALRSLCVVAQPGGMPLGSFPRAGVISQLFPEQPYES